MTKSLAGVFGATIQQAASSSSGPKLEVDLGIAVAHFQPEIVRTYNDGEGKEGELQPLTLNHFCTISRSHDDGTEVQPLDMDPKRAETPPRAILEQDGAPSQSAMEDSRDAKRLKDFRERLAPWLRRPKKALGSLSGLENAHGIPSRGIMAGFGGLGVTCGSQFRLQAAGKHVKIDHLPDSQHECYFSDWNNRANLQSTDWYI